MDASRRDPWRASPGRAPGAASRMLVFALLSMAAIADAARIYVFYPSMARPNAVQAALAGRMAGNDVTVFGRLADFTAMMAARPPDVILVPKPLADKYRDYRVFLRGARDGAPEVRAVLLSARPVEPGSVPVDVGVVGILERTAMTALVGSTLGGSPRLRIVTKVEDLLPLLQFNSADAVLVGEEQVEELKGKSAAKLVSSAVPGSRWGLLVAAAARDEAVKDVEPVLKALGASERKYLGVDGWTR